MRCLRYFICDLSHFPGFFFREFLALAKHVPEVFTAFYADRTVSEIQIVVCRRHICRRRCLCVRPVCVPVGPAYPYSIVIIFILYDFAGYSTHTFIAAERHPEYLDPFSVDPCIYVVARISIIISCPYSFYDLRVPDHPFFQLDIVIKVYVFDIVFGV